MGLCRNSFIPVALALSIFPAIGEELKVSSADYYKKPREYSNTLESVCTAPIQYEQCASAFNILAAVSARHINMDQPQPYGVLNGARDPRTVEYDRTHGTIYASEGEEDSVEVATEHKKKFFVSSYIAPNEFTIWSSGGASTNYVHHLKFRCGNLIDNARDVNNPEPVLSNSQGLLQVLNAASQCITFGKKVVDAAMIRTRAGEYFDVLADYQTVLNKKLHPRTMPMNGIHPNAFIYTAGLK